MKRLRLQNEVVLSKTLIPLPERDFTAEMPPLFASFLSDINLLFLISRETGGVNPALRTICGFPIAFRPKTSSAKSLTKNMSINYNL